jgi:RHS repeat-associated protein
MDDLSYSYNKNTDGELLNNRLRKVSELATVIGGYELPAEHQNDADIYTYDAIGNLTADKSEGIDNIEWTVYGKVRSVTRTKADTVFNIAYLYDASGNRVKKTVHKTYNTVSETLKQVTYFRDASGNNMLTHTTEKEDSEIKFKREFTIYGSSRLGMYRESETAAGELHKGSRVGDRTLGNRMYELSNHLGNVLVVVTDAKLPSREESGEIVLEEGLIASYVAQVVSKSDYYPFGLSMKERSFSDEEYRFGFGGQEKSDEVAEGNYTAEFWEYSSSTGRRWNVDPVVLESESGYAAFRNNPIFYNDPNGDCPDCNGGKYKIQKGDTFSALEKKWGYKQGTLQGMNPDLDPTTLQIGSTIKVAEEGGGGIFIYPNGADIDEAPSLETIRQTNATAIGWDEQKMTFGEWSAQDPEFQKASREAMNMRIMGFWGAWWMYVGTGGITPQTPSQRSGVGGRSMNSTYAINYNQLANNKYVGSFKDETAFSVVYNTRTGNVLMKPSWPRSAGRENTPQGWVFQQRGHGVVRGDLARMEGISSPKNVPLQNYVGATVRLKNVNGNKVFHIISWTSRSVNTPRLIPSHIRGGDANYSRHFEGGITNAIKSKYGVKTSTKLEK